MNGSPSVKYYTGGRGISASTLKIIAVAAMLIDHIAASFSSEIDRYLPAISEENGFPLPRVIGRIAFPIFAFLIAEGAGRTKNVYKYMLRLLVFALISEIPFDLALFHTPTERLLHETQHQNVFFTLLLGLVAIYLYTLLQKVRLEALSAPAALILAYLAENVLKTDYGAMGVICIFLFYIFLHAPAAAKTVGVTLTLLILPFIMSFLPSAQKLTLYMNTSLRYNLAESFAVLSLPLILMYNGEKGKKINKYAFYGFYPGHLLAIWGIYTLIIK